jgi:hypothetical protein
MTGRGDLNIKKVLSQKFIANRFLLMDIVKDARKIDAHKWRGVAAMSRNRSQDSVPNT